MIKQPARAIVEKMYTNPDSFIIEAKYKFDIFFGVRVDEVKYVKDRDNDLVLFHSCYVRDDIGLRRKDYDYIFKHAKKIREMKDKEIREDIKAEVEKRRVYWCEKYGVDPDS